MYGNFPVFREEFTQLVKIIFQFFGVKTGDIIPVEMPEHITVFVEELPTFRAKMGRSRDNVALQISEKIKRPDSVNSELHVFTKGGKKIDSDAELAELEDDLHLSDGVDLDW